MDAFKMHGGYHGLILNDQELSTFINALGRSVGYVYGAEALRQEAAYYADLQWGHAHAPTTSAMEVAHQDEECS